MSDSVSGEAQSTVKDAATATDQGTDASGSDSAAGLTADERAELDRLRAVHKEERRWERRAKDNFTDAEKFRALAKAFTGGDGAEDFDPKAEFAKLRNELQSERLERIRAEVARVKNVDPRYVIGANQEEMTAAADSYLSDVEARVKAALQGVKAPATESTSTVKGGDRVEGPKQITSEAELKKLSPADQLKAYQEGRLDKLIGR